MGRDRGGGSGSSGRRLGAGGTGTAPCTRNRHHSSHCRLSEIISLDRIVEWLLTLACHWYIWLLQLVNFIPACELIILCASGDNKSVTLLT